MANDSEQPILIRKRRKGHAGHAHHGGAWKVAYADFVTAMMAFFLMLWLLTAASKEQKEGLADYFSPVTIARSSQSGADGVLGGETITVDGAMVSDRTPFGITVTLPGDSGPESDTTDEITEDEEIPAVQEYVDSEERPTDEAGRLAEAAPGEREVALVEDEQPERSGSDYDDDDPLNVTREELERLSELKAEQDFETAVQNLRQAVMSTPELAGLADNLLVDRTPEGMRLQLVDQQGTSMFKRGSALPEEHTKKLFALISQALEKLPNRIAIKGHTDATPYRGDGSYSNWELSSDRALASRRALLEAGLDQSRIADVIGKADTEPLITEDTTDPQNRRISIILLNEPVVAAAPAPRAPASSASAPTAQGAAPASPQPGSDGPANEAANGSAAREGPPTEIAPPPAGAPPPSGAHPSDALPPDALPSDDGQHAIPTAHETAAGAVEPPSLARR